MSTPREPGGSSSNPIPEATPGPPESGIDRSWIEWLGSRLHGNVGARGAELLLVLLVGVGAVTVGSAVAGDGFWVGVAVVLLANALMLLVVWGGTRARGQRLDHLGFSLRWSGIRALMGTVWRSAITLVVAVVAFVVGANLARVVVSSGGAANLDEYNPLAGNLPLLLVSLPTVWFFSSFGEELVYRGFLITRLEELLAGTRAARPVALVLSSLLFGAAHYTWGWTGMIQTAFMGLALGGSYLVTGRRLWVTVLAHGSMDTILFLQMYARPTL